MERLENIISAFERGENIACPHCGSLRTQHGFTIVNEENRAGYGDIWCEDCKRGVHLSRLIVPEHAREGTVPAEINFE